MSQGGAAIDPLATVPETVLVVDDEPNIRRTLEMVLVGAGYRVIAVDSAEAALSLLEQRCPIDLAIVDLKLPGIGGLEALERLRADDAYVRLPVIVISGHATVHDAVMAIKLGANDFFEKPLNRERVLVSVSNGIRAARLSRTVDEMRAQAERRYEMLGASPPMQELFANIDKVAPTKATVLITGESGTGKELVSRAVHRLSPRSEAPFVKVNCAAIPRELIESELFGHEKGAFSGALGRKRGVFEQAHGGTLFLDEVGDMDLVAQAKVLRALQSGEITPVGAERALSVDVRVLAATNQDLAAAVRTGRFREDLFFRLQVFPLRVPSLRERLEDIPVLIDAFVATFCEENGLPARTLDPSVHRALGARRWPGNVRELKNVIERAAILASEVITVADLPEDPHESPFDDDLPEPPPTDQDDDGKPMSLRQYREAAERGFIVKTLREMDWNISKAAIRLGVERTNLHKKIRAYGIKRGESNEPRR